MHPLCTSYIHNSIHEHHLKSITVIIMNQSLANEAQLLQKINSLEQELQKYEALLQNQNKSNIYNDGDDNDTTEKAGYLFKWQDREIGWGGTKWARRFVKLDVHRGQLVSCFVFDFFRDYG